MSVERDWLPELDRLAAEMRRVEARIDAIVARVLPPVRVVEDAQESGVRDGG